MNTDHLSLHECTFLACILEVTARKPGNVHRYRDFTDLTYLDLVASAAAIAPVMAEAATRGVGPSVLEAIRKTRRVVRTNTNLGIVLLLAPLAVVPRDRPLQSGIQQVLGSLNLDDARAVYAAIRLAQPGGLGRVEREDVTTEPRQSLLDVMRLAASRDSVARQYASDYADVFGVGVPTLVAELARGAAIEDAIITCHLRLMAELPDTLIARKRGEKEAAESANRARRVLDGGGLETDAGLAVLRDLDAWLCAADHSRNPGATADLATASLFATLREGTMQWPGERPFGSLKALQIDNCKLQIDN